MTTTITYDEAKARADTLNAAVKAAGDVLRAYPTGPMGLTPDDVRATPQWKANKLAYDRAFAALRTFNQSFTKTFARQIRAERKARGR